MHRCCPCPSNYELIKLPDIETETGDEKWISLQAERIFVTESKSLSGGERASHWALIKGGMKAAWPICIGYIPLGFAFGVLAQKGPDGSSNGWTGSQWQS